MFSYSTNKYDEPIKFFKMPDLMEGYLLVLFFRPSTLMSCLRDSLMYDFWALQQLINIIDIIDYLVFDKI